MSAYAPKADIKEMAETYSSSLGYEEKDYLIGTRFLKIRGGRMVILIGNKNDFF